MDRGMKVKIGILLLLLVFGHMVELEYTSVHHS